MSRLYDRVIQIAIEQKFGDGGLFVEPKTLRTSFSVVKTPTSEPNRLQVSIWNLDRKSRAKIDYPGNIITVRAGYYDDYVSDGTPNPQNLPVVSVADLSYAKHKRQGGEFVTTIEAGEGEVAYRASFKNKKLSPPVSIISVFDTLLESFEESQVDSSSKPVNRGFGVVPNFKLTIQDATYSAKSAYLAELTEAYSAYFLNGVTLFGLTKDIMDKLTVRHGLIWYIDSGILTVFPATGNAGYTIDKTWSATNGLIGIPEELENGATQLTFNLNPAISVWSLQSLKMEIEKKYDGKTFKMGTIQHIGGSDSEDEFKTVAEGLPIGG